ncbi:MAG: TIGR03758 family integrating conjugative element protein [Proteobacteria bacterium]|jgi:integrating conjugative element protein (TIGR03758 family)|nr:TIGR03758 family integrating conjugative element protein [Pseudomonadota bacterium]
MSLSSDQSSAFFANAGFFPGHVSTVMLGIVFAVLLLYGAWAIKTAYSGWAQQDLSNAQFTLVAVRFLAIYLGLGFFLFKIM